MTLLDRLLHRRRQPSRRAGRLDPTTTPTTDHHSTATGSSSARAAPPSADPPVDPDRTAQCLFESWTRAAGELWIAPEGEAARLDLVEHLQRHPHLLVADPAWCERMVEVTVARATQVLLPAGYDCPGSIGRHRWLSDDVRDMLRGLSSIDGAQVPVSITPAFVTADRLVERYEQESTYENTPLGWMHPGRGMLEFPDTDGSIDAENDLLEFLREHPELAGTREFADWYDDLASGVRRPLSEVRRPRP